MVPFSFFRRGNGNTVVQSDLYIVVFLVIGYDGNSDTGAAPRTQIKQTYDLSYPNTINPI